jgi:hypothetical protein
VLLTIPGPSHHCLPPSVAPPITAPHQPWPLPSLPTIPGPSHHCPPSLVPQLFEEERDEKDLLPSNDADPERADDGPNVKCAATRQWHLLDPQPEKKAKLEEAVVDEEGGEPPLKKSRKQPGRGGHADEEEEEEEEEEELSAPRRSSRTPAAPPPPVRKPLLRGVPRDGLPVREYMIEPHHPWLHLRVLTSPGPRCFAGRAAASS